MDILTADSRQAAPSATLSARYGVILTVLAVTVLGAFPRLAFALAADFPLNDGGLFYVMIRDLQANGYGLPAVTSYNSAGIPFAYPPFGFYVAGLLSDWLRWPLLDIMRLLPPLVSIATIPAFYALARAVLRQTEPAVYALFAFALLPIGFDWLVMGGGLTRSFAVLFGIVTLHQAHHLFTRPAPHYLFTTAAAASLTVLSHAGVAWFVAYSVGLLFVFEKGAPRQAARAGGAALLTLMLTAPWWAAVLARHGAQPLLAAWQSTGSTWWSLVTPLFFLFTNEPLIDLFAVLGLLGFLASLRDRRWLLPAWLLTIFGLQTRGSPSYAIIPFAMLVGIGLEGVVLPGLSRNLTGMNYSTGHNSRVTRLIRLALFCYVLIVGFVSAYLASPRAYLSGDHRAAMAWVAATTPAGSRFAIVTSSTGSHSDAVSEWFPALSGRISLLTPQGYEWLPDRAFQHRNELYGRFQRCAEQSVNCLQPGTLGDLEPPGYIYVSLNTPAAARPLLTSLENLVDYALIYHNPSVMIFERR